MGRKRKLSCSFGILQLYDAIESLHQAWLLSFQVCFLQHMAEILYINPLLLLKCHNCFNKRILFFFSVEADSCFGTFPTCKSIVASGYMIWWLITYFWHNVRAWGYRRALRSFRVEDLCVGRSKTHFGGRAPSTAGPRCWTNLPSSVHSAVSVHSFNLRNWDISFFKAYLWLFAYCLRRCPYNNGMSLVLCYSALEIVVLFIIIVGS